MPVRRLVLALVGVVSSGGASTLASAFEPAPSGALELDWEAPASCPDEDLVRDRLDDFLGGRPHRAAEATGSIVAEDSGFTLTLAIDGLTKEVHALDCDDLGRTAALVLSLALAPEAESEPEPETPEPKTPEPETPEPENAPRAASQTGPRTQPEKRPEPEPEPEPAPAPAPARHEPRLRGAIRAEGGFHYNITPSATDAALVLAMIWPRARLEIPATLWTPSLVSPSDAAGQRGRTTIGTVGARGCFTPKLRRRPSTRPGRGPLEFPLCGGGELGAVRFAVFGSGASVRHGLWAAASATAAIAWPVHRLVALWAGSSAIVLLRRPQFALEGTSASYRINPAAFRAFLGVELRFP